jgi:hypothetical protein
MQCLWAEPRSVFVEPNLRFSSRGVSLQKSEKVRYVSRHGKNNIPKKLSRPCSGRDSFLGYLPSAVPY